jgi:hypothetical protein
MPAMRPLSRLTGALAVVALSISTSGSMSAEGRQGADPRSPSAAIARDGVSIKNDPPDILFAEQASILVLIDGAPVYRPIAGTDLQRIINTKPFIVRDAAGLHYMKVFDGWMEAYELTGLWSVSGVAPRGAAGALKQAVDEKSVDLLDGADPGRPDEMPALDDGKPPAIFISSEPAELFVTNGPPRFATIDGSALEYVENTTANVFKEPTDDELYVLTAGRWFRAWSIDGPWEFVPSRELPADFFAIPDGSPKAVVKASMAGTTQSIDARRQNDVPWTATISRRQTKLAPPVIDGDPNIQPIDGTSLSYVVNAPLPIIATNARTSYYAVQDGVWFVAAAIAGPWSVASTVPPAIYTIPPSSPLHHVTYVRIFNSTADDVSVGYTAGYLGTMLADGVVVYGTGYDYRPWIGTRWWGRPMTYGLGANLIPESAGSWFYVFGYGWSDGRRAWGSGVSPWWEPVAWGWRGERYPWVWRGSDAVRVPVTGDGGGVGAWRVAPEKNLYDRWRSSGS